MSLQDIGCAARTTQPSIFIFFPKFLLNIGQTDGPSKDQQGIGDVDFAVRG
jgi:hypothetical protein